MSSALSSGDGHTPKSRPAAARIAGGARNVAGAACIAATRLLGSALPFFAKAPHRNRRLYMVVKTEPATMAASTNGAAWPNDALCKRVS